MQTSTVGILIRREIITNRIAIALIGVLAFVVFTALGAYVYIPLGFTPVPLTLQTFFVLLSGAFLGKRWGSVSQILYLILGSVGLPLFFGGGWGVLHIGGPTGGYLLGFILAAYTIGRLLKNRDSLAAILTALICGELIILISGAAWLWAGFRLSLRQALYLGVIPFIPGDTLKLMVAVFICRRYLRRAKGLFYSL